MVIIEKISKNYYIGKKETGIYKDTRFLIETENEINEGDVISIDNPIECKMQTLCNLCNNVYGGGKDYTERLKQQAIDYYCGFITIDELEF